MLKSKTINTTDSGAKVSSVSLKDFVIPEMVYDFPRIDRVPSGYYYSEIIDVQPRISAKGKKCLDVIYALQGFYDKLGDHIIRLRYPEGSQPLQDLYKAMLNAGVSPGPNMACAIGVTEKIHLIYEHEDGIGSIYKRVYDPVQDDILDECSDSKEDPDDYDEEDER